MNRFAAALDAMSNAKRLEVLAQLLQGERCVNALADSVGLSQSSLSQHLAKLRSAKLVTTRRDAQTVYYSVSSPVVRDVLMALQSTYGKPLSVSKTSGRASIHIH